MEFNCSDNEISYRIHPTDGNRLPFVVPGFALDKETMDITLVGKSRLEYGKDFNENILHLLEHFSSPSVDANIPDNTNINNELLTNPQLGQLWFNSYYNILNMCVSDDPQEWRHLLNSGSVSGNCGFIFDGEEIPLPVDANGNEFLETDCYWIVSPAFINSEAYGVDSYSITTTNRIVSAEFTRPSSDSFKCFAYYTIIGIKKYNV